MIIVERNVIINASPQHIFTLLTSQFYRNQWESSLVEERVLPDENLHVGTRLYQVRRVLGGKIELNFMVSEFEPGKRYRLQSPPDARPSYASTYVMEPSNGGTRVTFSSAVDPRGYLILVVLSPLIRMIVAREVSLILGALKKAAEAS